MPPVRAAFPKAFVLLVLILALLVSDAAGSLAGGLAGGLALAAATGDGAFVQVAGIDGLNSLHHNLSILLASGGNCAGRAINFHKYSMFSRRLSRESGAFRRKARVIFPRAQRRACARNP